MVSKFQQIANRRHLIVVLLFLATLLNYFDRQILALVSPVLRADFSLTASQYSLLLGAFLLGYSLMQFPAGWLVDRLGARSGLMLAMLWWSAAGAAAAATRHAGELALCLFLMGVGEAANWPGAVKAIQEWFPAAKRATATGFFNAGSSAGAVLAPIVVTALTLRYSWRAAFAVCGALGLLWIMPWRLTYSHPAFETAPKNNTEGDFAFFRDIRAWGVILARLFADSIWYFYIFWLPDYLSRVQSLSLKSIGAMAWIPFLAAGLGNLAGGSASSYLIGRKKNVVQSRLFVMGAAALVMSLGAVVRYCHLPSLALALISAVVFAYSAWAANVLTLPADIFPPTVVATVTGCAGTIAGLAGVFTMYLAGRTIDRFSYGPIFIGVGILPLVALACSLLCLNAPRSS